MRKRTPCYFITLDHVKLFSDLVGELISNNPQTLPTKFDEYPDGSNRKVFSPEYQQKSLSFAL